MKHRFALTALGVGVALVVAVFVKTVAPGGSGDTHTDGEGILASSGSPAAQEMRAAPSATGSVAYSFGLKLCAFKETAAPITIDSIEARSTVGARVTVLGARAHAWTVKPPPAGLLFWDAYPPPETAIAYPLFDLEGALVTNSCGSDSIFEAIVGLRLDSPGHGGGWDGQKVHYRVGGKQYTLVLDNQWVICGTSSRCLDSNASSTPAAAP